METNILENFLNNKDNSQSFTFEKYFTITKDNSKKTLIRREDLINGCKININTVKTPYLYRDILNKGKYENNFIEKEEFNKICLEHQKYDLNIDEFKDNKIKEINQNIYIFNVSNTPGGGNNFFHFFMHYLPKIYLYIYFIDIFRNNNVKLLVNYDRMSSWMKDILMIAGLNEDDFLINNKGNLLNFGTNFIPNYTNISCDNVEIIDMLFNFYQKNIVEKILISNKTNINKEYPKNIIILRKKTSRNSSDRHIINREDIISLSKKYNFIEIENDTLKIEESIKIFNNADNIIIESGAGIINIFWTNIGSNIIVLNTLATTSKFENIICNWYNTKILSERNIKIIDSNKPDVKFEVSNNKNDKYYNLPYIFDGFEELKNLLDDIN